MIPAQIKSCEPVKLEGSCGPDGVSNILITSQDNADFFEVAPFTCDCTGGDISNCLDGNGVPIDRINMCGIGPSGNFPQIDARIVDDQGNTLEDENPVELIDEPSINMSLPLYVDACDPVQIIGTTPPVVTCYPDGVANVTIESLNGNDDFVGAPFTCDCTSAQLANCMDVSSASVTDMILCGTGTNGIAPVVIVTIEDANANTATDQPFVNIN